MPAKLSEKRKIAQAEAAERQALALKLVKPLQDAIDLLSKTGFYVAQQLHKVDQILNRREFSQFATTQLHWPAREARLYAKAGAVLVAPDEDRFKGLNFAQLQKLCKNTALMSEARTFTFCSGLDIDQLSKQLKRDAAINNVLKPTKPKASLSDDAVSQLTQAAQERGQSVEDFLKTTLATLQPTPQVTPAESTPAQEPIEDNHPVLLTPIPVVEPLVVVETVVPPLVPPTTVTVLAPGVKTSGHKTKAVPSTTPKTSTKKKPTRAQEKDWEQQFLACKRWPEVTTLVKTDPESVKSKFWIDQCSTDKPAGHLVELLSLEFLNADDVVALAHSLRPAPKGLTVRAVQAAQATFNMRRPEEQLSGLKLPDVGILFDAALPQVAARMNASARWEEIAAILDIHPEAQQAIPYAFPAKHLVVLFRDFLDRSSDDFAIARELLTNSSKIVSEALKLAPIQAAAAA